MYSSSIGEKAKLPRLLGIVSHQSLKYSLPPTLVSELLSSYALYLRISLQYSLTLYPMQHISKRAKIADSSPTTPWLRFDLKSKGLPQSCGQIHFPLRSGRGSPYIVYHYTQHFLFPHQFCCTTPLCTISANTLLASASYVLIAPLE